MAQDLYYIQASSSLALFKQGDSIPYIWNNISSLEISGSAYNATISGSDFGGTVGTARIYAYSSSTLLVSFPLEETNIYYNTFPDYAFSSPVFPPNFTSSYSYASWNLNIENTISFTSGQLSGSGGSIYDSSSAALYLSQNIESNAGSFPLISGNNYIFTVSGSGSVQIGLYINNTTSGSVIFSQTASSGYISASYVPLAFNDYSVTFSVIGTPP
jgi:hypothetical protein